MLGRRRGSAPDLPLAADERLLAHAEGPDGAVGGTRAALSLPIRVPWERVASAGWDEEGSRLRVVEQAPWGEVAPEHVRRLDDAGRLLQLVRERVTASLVLQRSVAVHGSRSVRILARRAPAGDGPIAWFVEYDAGLDPTDPSVRAVVDDALCRARGDVGD